MSLEKILIKIGCVEFGNFVLKNGEKTDIYVDFRKVISYPVYYSYIIDYLKEIMPQETVEDTNIRANASSNHGPVRDIPIQQANIVWTESTDKSSVDRLEFAKIIVNMIKPCLEYLLKIIDPLGFS